MPPRREHDRWIITQPSPRGKPLGMPPHATRRTPLPLPGAGSGEMTCRPPPEPSNWRGSLAHPPFAPAGTHRVAVELPARDAPTGELGGRDRRGDPTEIVGLANENGLVMQRSRTRCDLTQPPVSPR